MPASLGRRPTPLSIDPGKFRIMTLQIGRKKIKSYLSDASAAILHSSECSSRLLQQSAKDIDDALLEYVKALLNEWQIKDKRFFAIAIGAPGLIRTPDLDLPAGQDKRDRRPYFWDTLHDRLVPHLHCPVFVENDANLMVLGEQWFGAGKGSTNFIFYDIGEGIGAAPIIDDMLYRGHNTMVAEIGHITVDMHGEKCSCGNYGCLELYASFSRLRQKFLDLRKDRKPRSYESDITDLFKRFAAGDAECRRLVHDHAKIVAIGAVSLANMFSPEKIIVGAHDCDAIALAPYVEQMRQDVARHAYITYNARIAIEPSSLGPDIMSCGGVALVMSELLGNAEWLAGTWDWHS